MTSVQTVFKIACLAGRHPCLSASESRQSMPFTTCSCAGTCSKALTFLDLLWHIPFWIYSAHRTGFSPLDIPTGLQQRPTHRSQEHNMLFGARCIFKPFSLGHSRSDLISQNCAHTNAMNRFSEMFTEMVLLLSCSGLRHLTCFSQSSTLPVVHSLILQRSIPRKLGRKAVWLFATLSSAFDRVENLLSVHVPEV